MRHMDARENLNFTQIKQIWNGPNRNQNNRQLPTPPLKLDHKTSQSLLKRHLSVNMINDNVPENIEHQSLPRPQLM